MKEYFSVQEVAKLLGISRIAVFKKIQKGQLPAKKIGRNYVIHKKDLGDIFGNLSQKTEKTLEKAVDRVVEEFGETLRLLGNE